LIHQDRLTDLPALCERLAEKRVEIYADERARQALITYPNNLIKEAAEDTYSTEWMDYKMGIKTVANIDEAIEHISTYGSGHSECIITNDSLSARKFQESVDAACVYVNAPTSFTDGAQFGLGAEIGISTQKLGPRGPMGLKEITTYKYYIDGNGQVRQ
jgi:glutamate-5-semialdehyde dehydrogenase